MIESPFFSVIIPTYNRPERLKRAVESVLKQLFQNFEIIVVNNYYENIVSPFDDKRIVLVNESQKGAAFARNRGISESRGEFICFLDDDDIYLENHLEVLHELIVNKKEEVALYRTYTRVQDEKGVIRDQAIKLAKSQEERLNHVMTTLITMHCVCCHREILEKMKFDTSLKVAEDYHLWIRILDKYPLYEKPEITTVYYKTPGSVSSPGIQNYFDHIRMFESLFSNQSIRSKISRNIRNDRLFHYYNLILIIYYKDLNLQAFVKITLGILRHKFSYLLRLEYWKVFLKFVYSKLKR